MKGKFAVCPRWWMKTAIDIVTQIAAVRAALRRVVEEEMLKDHVSHCVEHAIASGNKVDQRAKISELMAVISRADR